MPKSLKVKVGNKAKSRRSYNDKAKGRYERQFLRTEANKARRRAKLLLNG